MVTGASIINYIVVAGGGSGGAGNNNYTTSGGSGGGITVGAFTATTNTYTVTVAKQGIICAPGTNYSGDISKIVQGSTIIASATVWL